jgi:alpha-L-rhamnosidase
VSWKLEGGWFVLDLTVPPNSWATVHVPAGDPAMVMEGDRAAASAEGVTAGGEVEGAAVFSVRSGTYRFSTEVK